MAEAAQDVDTLKRRGRRRLVGAVALVLLAVIVLPMVFDPEPRRPAPPVSVRIPGEDDSAFPPKPAPEKKAEAPAPAEKKAEAPAPAEKKAEAPAQAEKKAEPDKSQEKARAEAALAGADFIIPVGAVANAR